MKDIFESSEPLEQRAILNYVLQNPTVSGKRLEYTLRKPLDTVLELAHHPTMLPILDKFRIADWQQAVNDFALLKPIFRAAFALA